MARAADDRWRLPALERLGAQLRRAESEGCSPEADRSADSRGFGRLKRVVTPRASPDARGVPVRVPPGCDTDGT
jgi:hypothetical protein